MNAEKIINNLENKGSTIDVHRQPDSLFEGAKTVGRLTILASAAMTAALVYIKVAEVTADAITKVAEVLMDKVDILVNGQAIDVFNTLAGSATDISAVTVLYTAGCLLGVGLSAASHLHKDRKDDEALSASSLPGVAANM